MTVNRNEKKAELLQEEPIVGNSPEAKRVRRAVKKLSKIDNNVLIIGETGVGKEFVARQIHIASVRKNKGFVKINCSTLGITIDMKDLLGEEAEGAQAVTRKIGLLEKAHKGVLFLDNLDKMPAEFQEKFLQILKDKKFRRVGGKESIDLDVRVISVADDDLAPEVEKGNFKRQLFHLLNTLTLRIPSLSERKQDVPEFFTYLLKKYCAETEREEPAVPSEIFESILEYNWKGNVRELENTVQNLVAMSPEGELSADFLPFRIKKHRFDFLEPTNIKGVVHELEIFLIKKALGKFGGNQVKAAKLLGIPEATLRFKMKKYSIPKE